MHIIYKAIYYNGRSSRGYDALLSLQDGFLVISYLNEGEEPVFRQWLQKDIRSLTATGHICTFQYGAFPYESIVTGDAALLKLLRQNTGRLDRQYKRLLNDDWKIKTGLTALFLGLVALFYFFIIPGTAAFLAGQLPQQLELQLGEQLYKTVMHDYEKDEELSRLANNFAAQLKFKTDYPIEISVVRQDELNAFAMPGGHIVVYDGLLYQLESAEAFAALLGHEVAHVKHRHSLKSISRSLSSYLFVSFILSDLNGITSVLVENAHMLSRLSYSRELEQAADQEALDLLALNKLDQQGLVQLMETLEEQEQLVPPTLLSSHPLTADRITYAKQQMQTGEKKSPNNALNKIWKQLKEVQQ